MKQGAAGSLRVLHVEDSALDVELVEECLRSAGFKPHVDVVLDEPPFAELLAREQYDVILADYSLPRFDAPRTLEVAAQIRPGVPFIAVSGSIGEERAVELLKRGATDYVLKERLEKLPVAVQRALEKVAEQQARRKAEEALRRINRELRAITKCTETLMRADDEQALLASICRIVCEDAGYRMAWVGYIGDNAGGSIQPQAWAGLEQGFFQEVRSTRPSELLRGSASRALRTGAPACIQDLARDPGTSTWGASAVARGYRAELAVPLKDHGRTFGVLGIYSEEAGSFTADEVRILEELGADLAFGITVLRARKVRARAELALGESEAKLRAILDGIGIGICLIDRDMHVLEMNARMRTWYAGLESLPQVPCHQAFGEAGSSAPCAGCPALRTLADGEVHEATLVRTIQGVKRDCRVVTSPIFDPSGSVVAIVEMVEDITERVVLEARLQHAQKMDAVGRLAGGVAHDFNNALNVILGNADMALSDLGDSPVREGLLEIKDAAERSANLTRQLLAFARAQPVKPKLLDLNEAVTEMLRMLRRLIGEHIELGWRPCPGEGLVEIDPSEVDRILANLCVNARDAIQGIGRVAIETERVRVGPGDHPVVPAGAYIVLRVADDGEGMDETTRLRIFEPFFTTKALGRGSGLGLATVYGIVAQNHGFVDVSSELGRGTTFEIFLPAASGSLPGEGAAAQLAAPEGHETILLVEDDEANLRTTERFLSRLGYRVLAASSPADAERVSAAHAAPIHLLLSDLVMPGESGQDSAARLVRQRPELRCVFMSGYSAKVLAPRTELIGPLLEKPFSMSTLANRLREILDGSTRGAGA